MPKHYNNPIQRVLAIIGAALLALLSGVFVESVWIYTRPPEVPPPSTPLTYTFNTHEVLAEAGAVNESSSPYFWLNSGGELWLTGEIGETIQGGLSQTDPWYRKYKKSNPVDTDEGFHPQNLFRLITKGVWENISESAQFYIARDNLSSSPNRNQSNGLLLMSRYRDRGQTLYYAGIRVDGTAVIKKKYKGIYYTMAQKQIFPGTYTLSSGTTANLLPHAVWLTLNASTITNPDGSVTITLSYLPTGYETWTELLSSTDRGAYGSTPPITGASNAGIRTDFMDVEFDNYRIEPVSTTTASL